MTELLTTIVTWLSINFGLPASFEHPRVEVVSAARLAEVRYERLLGAGLLGSMTESGRAASGAGGMVFAVYDDASRTIYLNQGWTGATPADTSLLVHEMVHHLQNLARMTFMCAGEREKDAYRAQRRWLEMFGHTLEEDFRLDPMTILARTNCFF